MMRNFYLLLLILLMPGFSMGQTTADFENYFLEKGEYIENADPEEGFSSGKVFLPNHYFPEFESWAGWALSADSDTTTPGFNNQFSAIPGAGVNASNTYAVSSPGAQFEATVLKLQGEHVGGQVQGMYVTNNTYAYLSMLNGDNFAKKFGGPTGDDPDFFRLIVEKYLDGQLQEDSVVFYLADYRFQDNSKDYIVDEWTWVDLSSLGQADSLRCSLWSSDVGQFGMNTPAYFCIDNVVTEEAATAIEEVRRKPSISIYPNPVGQTLYLQREQAAHSHWTLIHSSGSAIKSGEWLGTKNALDISALEPGQYFLEIKEGKNVSHHPIIIH